MAFLAGVDPDLVAARPVRCLFRIAVRMAACDVTGDRGLLVAGMRRIRVTATARPAPRDRRSAEVSRRPAMCTEWGGEGLWPLPACEFTHAELPLLRHVVGVQAAQRRSMTVIISAATTQRYNIN
ncbi:hypothetical protein [Nonomuraea sp. CA-141351]|uniref:hypothetical protein n=1 Tax=Nonomuraea sp. CA-141351 TaxID=3239996 RepID=UPI003D948C0A